MARRELGPDALLVASAVAGVLPGGDVVVGVSGGADSMALALGVGWAASRVGATPICVIVDHGLQQGSAEVARQTADALGARGLRAEIRRVDVDEADPDGPEAAARRARLAALTTDGLPVLLGHTLDDQAETVLLGLLRGSGTRSLAGMAPVRGPFLRPLLGLRRATTAGACRDWGIGWWEDPQNADPRFMRVRVREFLAGFGAAADRDLAPNLARTASLARQDADLLDELALKAANGLDLSAPLPVRAVRHLPDALRLRVLSAWLCRAGFASPEMVHLQAVDALVRRWHGQGPAALPGVRVVRREGSLFILDGECDQSLPPDGAGKARPRRHPDGP